MKKLPIGIQTFREIRENGYLYVDKTEQIYELITKGKTYFLSRPRRFGKSLLISTLEEIFQGNKELFKKLYIYNTDYNWEKHPIVRISFGGNLYENKEVLKKYIKESIKKIAKQYNINLKEKSLAPATRELIVELSKINKVVILIDEYDKPLIDNLEKGKEEIYKENREMLKAFYSIFKEMDQYLKFIFLTGVSKFSKVGVFSGLNNLEDITMDARFCNLIGWNQKELEHNFADNIKALAQIEKLDQKEIIKKIKKWYNGYRFSDKDEKVYNPFSTLLLFSQQAFKLHWFETGTPTFLINLIKEQDYDIRKLEKLEIGINDFSTYEIESLDILPLLFQTGYLTIKNYIPEDMIYELGYPNFEVKSGFLYKLMNAQSQQSLSTSFLYKITKALRSNNLDEFFLNLRIFFANIPYDLHLKNEKYYQTIFYLVFTLLGLRIKVETKTNQGRIDATIETDNDIYIFEFKLFDTKEKALEQIKEKKYYEKFLNKNKPIHLIGVEFDPKERNVGEMVEVVINK